MDLNGRNVLCRSGSQDGVWEVPHCCVWAGDLWKRVVRFQDEEENPTRPSSVVSLFLCQLVPPIPAAGGVVATLACRSPSASLHPLSPKSDLLGIPYILKQYMSPSIWESWSPVTLTSRVNCLRDCLVLCYCEEWSKTKKNLKEEGFWCIICRHTVHPGGEKHGSCRDIPLKKHPPRKWAYEW